MLSAVFTIVPVLPSGQKNQSQNAKGVKKIVWGWENLLLNFRQIYQKRPEKGPNFL
jgi:hypothetical protein